MAGDYAEEKRKGVYFCLYAGETYAGMCKESCQAKRSKDYFCAYDISLRRFKQNIGDIRLSLGPDEFLSLLDGADYVVTGSFHATAFSLILQKKFFVEVPPKVGSRITDLLDSFDLRDRIFNGAGALEDREMDWSKVEQKMNHLRQQSLTSLRRSIEAAVHD